MLYKLISRMAERVAQCRRLADADRGTFRPPREMFRSKGNTMKMYRIDKLAKHGGMVVKRKHILASSDRNAVEQATDSPDCPICDVIRDGAKIGSIL